MTTKTNKISPLEELRMEKASLKQECAKKEAALEEHWNYLSENAGSLLIGCAVSNVKRSLGLAPVRTKIKDGRMPAESRQKAPFKTYWASPSHLSPCCGKLYSQCLSATS